MTKVSENIEGNNANTMLAAGYSYSLGKFQLYMDEDTGELKIMVHTNKQHLQIKPSSGNAVVLIACR